MKKTSIALAAATLCSAFTLSVLAQQPATPPTPKGQAPSPTDLSLNKRSESGAQATTGAGAATGAGQPQGPAQPAVARSGAGVKAKSQTNFKADADASTKQASSENKRRTSKGRPTRSNADDPTAGDVPRPR